MNREFPHRRLALLVPALLAAGCGSFNWNLTPEKKSVEEDYVDVPAERLTKSLAFRDTVGEQGYVEGLRMLRVRGYGLVAGLGNRGSRECPRQVRDRLIQEMYKRPEFSSQGLRPVKITPEQLIDDLDTAVVMIEGDIPAAAIKGSTFDVNVVAMAGSQTVSLEGGRLYTASLHIYRDMSGGAIEGQLMGSAAGPIFINPFSGEAGAKPADVRQGVVIGGGAVKDSRRLRIVLTTPSYQRAQAIMETINARFPHDRRVANATSPAYVELRVPREFESDPFHFLALVRHLYLARRPGFAEERARKLTEEVLDPDAPHADIALAWEGIGRTVVPTIQDLYNSDQPHARFYAALAGLRLGDDASVDTVESFAYDSTSSYRLTAIEELGRSRTSTRAALILRRLLEDPDPRIRAEAYEALLARGDHAIQSRPVGNGRFHLDTVACRGENLIYVRRTGAPRIALLGGEMRLTPPLFYQDRNDLVTVNAEIGDAAPTVIRRTTFAGRASPPLSAPPALAAFIPMLGDDPEVRENDGIHGLALDYSTITHALFELCRIKAIDAKFMMQTPSVTEMFGPLDVEGRRESDL